MHGLCTFCMGVGSRLAEAWEVGVCSAGVCSIEMVTSSKEDRTW